MLCKFHKKYVKTVQNEAHFNYIIKKYISMTLQVSL